MAPAQAAVPWTTNLAYAAFDVAAWVFVGKKVPELTGEGLESIEGRLREGRFAPADVR